jgi:RHS repeat-associated protein
VTNEAGQVIRRYDYMPFGELWQPTYPIAERHLFTGQERDHETGLDYFGARYYRPDIGRFTTVDPGHVGGNISDPQSWNAYGYGRNNPLRFVDPTGKEAIIALYDHDAFEVSDTAWGWIQSNSPGFRFIGGYIQQLRNGSWVDVGKYVDPLAYLLGQIGNTAAPIVPVVEVTAQVFVGVASVAVPPMGAAYGLAQCAAAGTARSAAGTAMAMALSPKAAKILGNLAGQAGKTIAQMIRLRRGGGSQINKVATHLQHLPLGEVAERAARGDEAAKTAIKVVKDAKRLGEKY